MSRLGMLLALGLIACSSAPSRVRVQISLEPDAAAFSDGPARLSLFGAGGRLIDAALLSGRLPGDVVVLLDEDAGKVRAVVVVSRSGGIAAQGTGGASVLRGQEVRLPVQLSTVVLADLDGDGVPDDIDDCPALANPAQGGSCPQDDLGAPIDLGAPVDLAADPCGNGLVEPGEACDTGAGNSDDPAVQATCTTACKRRTPCGVQIGATAVRIDRDSGHCYLLWPGPLGYTAAERDCLSRGGHLAAITSAAENTLVQGLTMTSAAWIGLVAPAAGAPNVWTTTESSSYAAFRAGEPTRIGESCVVSLPATAGWEDRACGWAAVGTLPPSTVSTAAFVCEQSCGNGVVDPGEACDPPGATCTATCRTVRACTEAGGMTSPASGACYFKAATAATYDTALATGCPAGTHLATPSGPFETETALKVIDVDAWIAVRAAVTLGSFGFDVAGFPFDASRYHGFATPDPDQATLPACAVVTKGDARGDGWRDRPCANSYPPLCQRD